MTTPETLVEPALENVDETNQELQLVQRKYRRLQDYIMHEEAKLRCQKQLEIMKSLEKEKFEIITSLNVASSRAHVENEADVRKSVKERVELTDRLDKDIRMAELNVKELNDHIFQGQKQVMVLSRQVDSEYTSTRRELHTLKSINCLESRLSVNIEKCNITLRDNARLRKQILDSIKERRLFNKMYTYLIARLDAGKKVVADMVEQTTVVYDQREECQGRVLLLKKNSRHNLFTHRSEMQSLHRSVDHEMCLQEFLRAKGTKRIMETVMARRRLKRIQKLNEVKRSISNYRGILRNIKKFTNQTDLTVISNAFKNQEELNFSLFQKVNFLKDQEHVLGVQVKFLEAEIDEERAKQKAKFSRHQNHLKSLSLQNEKWLEESEQVRERIERISQLIKLILQGVQNVFLLCRCDNSPLLDLLGDNTMVTQFNYSWFLTLIERRAHEIINVIYYQQWPGKLEHEEREYATTIKQTFKAKLHPVPISALIPSHPCSFCVEQEEFLRFDHHHPQPHSREHLTLLVNKRTSEGEVTIKEVVHNVSMCKLPKSRKLVQRRFQ